jgi:hypothetical protein
MRFRELQLACVCGHVPNAIAGVGFTSEYELVVHWTCEACDKTMYAVKSLADCCRECPDDQYCAQVREGGPLTQGDDDFLRSLGIRTP